MTGGLKFLGLAACTLGAVLLFCGEASANPITLPSDRYFWSVSSGIAYLFVVNLPVDLLAYSSALLLTFVYLGDRTNGVTANRRKFVTAVVVAVVLVAVAGSIIDFFLLYEPYSPSISTVYFFDFDILKAALGSILVAASIFLVSVVLVRSSYLAGSLVALSVGLLNFVSWSSLTDGYGFVFKELFWFSVALFIAAGVPVYGLVRWHEHRGVSS